MDVAFVAHDFGQIEHHGHFDGPLTALQALESPHDGFEALAMNMQRSRANGATPLGPAHAWLEGST